MTPLLLAFGLVSALAEPRDSVLEPLSLKTALARANAQNPQLRALRERGRAAVVRGQMIRRQKLPRFGMEIGAEHTNNPASVFADRLNAGGLSASDLALTHLNAPEAVSHLGSSVFVEVPIDLFGRFTLASEVHARGEKALNENIREAEAGIALEVIDTYLGVVASRQALLATDHAVTAARSREETTAARFTQGVALHADVLRMRARRREREADLASRRADLDAEEARLARLLGDAGARFELIDTARPSPAVEPLEVWMARAHALRAVLFAAQGQSEAAALAVRMERQTSRPFIAAQARVSDDRLFPEDARSWVVGVSLRWAFYDATRGKRIAAALADERAFLEEQHAAADRVRFEVDTAFSRLRAANERMTAAEGGREESREALRVVQERRAQGVATLTDELETESAAFAAELEEINAARRAAVAEAALRRAAGVNLVGAVQ